MSGRRPDPAAGMGDLEAALTREACPVCTRAAGADERWLDHFLYEGWQEREPMREVARGAGFCAHHARRLETIGQSATVALIHLALIRDVLPRLAGRHGRGKPAPLVAAPDACEACAQARDVERRECFFLALLIGARRPDCYGNPALVCMPHLKQLAGYLDAGTIAGVLAIHGRTVAALGETLAGAPAPACAETPADRAIRVILGPPERRDLLAPERHGAPFGDDPDPVRRMRRRLRHMDSCAICAEISDSCGAWLGWLARAAAAQGDLSDVLPLCRHHVWQARVAGGAILAPALAAVVVGEAEERLVYAGKARELGRGAAIVPPAVQRAWSSMWPSSGSRIAVLDSLQRGRECPLCRRAREAGERAVLLLAALLEDTDGRRAFEGGYGLCVRHAAQALALPGAPAVAAIVASTMHARLALLRWELEEQLRRGAWQARPAGRGAEAGAWLRAPSRFAGTVRVDGP